MQQQNPTTRTQFSIIHRRRQEGSETVPIRHRKAVSSRAFSLWKQRGFTARRYHLKRSLFCIQDQLPGGTGEPLRHTIVTSGGKHTRLQRCIGVDIRYILFIMEKYGKAGQLVDELVVKNDL